ncbi:MAG: energy-coupling factor transporter ATPase [Clostridiales bacterium]|nr:energy-coupling factor transporter ATPase [Clostridiales bacterium]
MASMIEAEGVSYKYPSDDEEAVHSATFSISQGEFVAILGHNGSGKSTLAKLMNALFLPTEGVLRVGDIPTHDAARVWDVRSMCGMVFQNPDNQLVATIVEEDVAFGLENLGVPSGEIRRRVDEALQMVGMTGYKLSAPHLLSGGQKQRVAIAGVLAMRPAVIVFDEATAMLDPVGRAEVMKVVRRINRDEGITVVWITHFMEEAALADRLIVMDGGEIRMEGAPGALFEQADRLKALGLGLPEMAELAGQLRAAGLPLGPGILTVDEMVVELCRLKSNA